MRSLRSFQVIAILLASLASNLHAQVRERDPLNKFSVTRPASWTNEDRPSPAVRVILGFKGDGYAGGCNISVLPSQSTARMSQAEVDASENMRPLGIPFWQSALRSVALDVKVLSESQTKRGPHFGHLIRYTYSYLSPSIQQRVYLHAELFTHSRPGKVFSFTCNTGALTAADARSAFSNRGPSSFRVEPNSQNPWSSSSPVGMWAGCL